MVVISRFIQKTNTRLKSRKALGFLAVAVGYIFMVDINLQQRARLLRDHHDVFRDLITLDKGDGVCDIRSPTADGTPAGEETTKTLLVSYPGSGKRFTWTIIKALTNSEVADDWNFSGKLNEVDSPLTVKTSWPHKEGVWSWNKLMDQVILLIRDPSRAIPSYHNMRFELDYAEDWASSYAQIPKTYKERPAVRDWENWRDANFEAEMDQWVNMIEFWMQGGYEESTGQVHSRCQHMEIDCTPKAIVDFDHFYQPGANSDFIQLSRVLEDSLQDSGSVKVISSQIRACALSQVFENDELHQGGRPDAGTEYTFTLYQLDTMLRKVTDLRDKYIDTTEADTRIDANSAMELVVVLNKYMSDIAAKRYLATETVVEKATARAFGSATCEDMEEGAERDACIYTTSMSSHGFLSDMEYPEESFPYDEYLAERADLVRFYNNNGGANWKNKEGWMDKGDHCDWENIACNDDKRIVLMQMGGNNLSGNFPTDLDNLVDLAFLDLTRNSLSGSVTQALCDKPNFFLMAMADNCDNEYHAEIGAFGRGCCNQVMQDFGSF